MSKAKYPRLFSELTGELYRSLGLREAYQQHQALTIWHEVVGEGISHATSIERFTAGRLYVRVRSAAWRMELSFRKEEIRKKLNTALESPLVQEIIFK